MHTESTLDYLDASTKSIGQQLRHFVKFTCPAFETVELPKEAAARGRRKEAKAVSARAKEIAEVVGPDDMVAEIAPDAPAASSSTDAATNGVASQPAPKGTEAVGPDDMVTEMAPDAPVASSSTDPATNGVASQPAPKVARRRRTFNMNTVKAHFLGDYGRTIRLFGTTDSYSTQTVSYIPHTLVTAILNSLSGRVGTPSSETAV